MKLKSPLTRKKIIRVSTTLGNSILGIGYTLLLPTAILAAVCLLLLLTILFTRIIP